MISTLCHARAFFEYFWNREYSFSWHLPQAAEPTKEFSATAGIAQAVYSAMMASNGGGSQYINNTIEVDGVAIARAVTKGQRSLDRRYSPTMA